jgi:hypothetical protein
MSDEARTCWIVQYEVDPLPKEQWSCHRYWPFVEVYEQWRDAFTRLGELRDKGFAVFFAERPFVAAVPVVGGEDKQQ